MALSVLLLPAPVDADIVVIIDALRFTSAACYAMANGARSIVPFRDVEAARAFAAAWTPTTDAPQRPLLAGERHALKPDGFDLGNSPLEFTRDTVRGRDIAWSTTNGTRAIEVANLLGRVVSPRPPSPSHTLPQSSSLGVRDALLASPVNLKAVCSLLAPRLQEGATVAIVCSGREGGLALEDAATAGRLVTLLRERLGDALPVDDGARASASISEAYGEDFARCFGDAQHGRTLRELGFGSDLEACAACDAIQVVPRWRDGRFVAG